MRLLLLDQFSDPGGAQQCLLDLLPAIRERGWQALAAMPGDGEMFRSVARMGFSTGRLECGPYRSGKKSPADLARFAKGTPALARQIRRMAERLDANLVYVNGPRLLPAAALARVPVPMLFHAHSYLPPGFSRKLAGTSLRRAGAWVLANCRYVAEPWRSYVGDERISVVYNAAREPGAAGLRTSTAPAVGCIGRIAPEKGQREFLEAAAAIHRAVPACRFFIYGAPLFSECAALRYDAEVRASAARLPVEFPGWVTDVYAAMANLDLLLVPSAAYEATPRVILESFAAGVPVIAFRSGGIPEIIQDGADGLLAGSTGELARMAIDLLTGDPARLRSTSAAARESWRRRFTLDRYRRQVLDVIERVIDNCPRF
jgi:glycosyltransferase involved in cell wall biosynthesis